MAKRTISFGDYKEPTWEEYTGEPPLAGRWYTGVVKRATYNAERDQVAFIVEITDGEFKGWGKGWYAPLEPSDSLFWKTQEIIRALQGGKTTDVSIDWENEKAVETWLKKSKAIKFKTELYNDDIKIKKVGPLLAAVGGSVAPAPAPVVEAADEAEEALEDYTEAELKAKTAEELEEILLEEFEFGEEDVPEEPTGRGAALKYKKLLIAAVLEAQAEEEETEEAEGEEAEGDEDFEDGFDEGDEDEDEAEEEPEPEPEPEPAKPARRARKTAAPAAAPAPAKAAPAARRRRS